MTTLFVTLKTIQEGTEHKHIRPILKALYVSVAEQQNEAVDLKDISTMYPD